MSRNLTGWMMCLWAIVIALALDMYDVPEKWLLMGIQASWVLIATWVGRMWQIYGKTPKGIVDHMQRGYSRTAVVMCAGSMVFAARMLFV